MMPFSIFQPASAGLREGPLRAATVQPVKSLPLKSGFHGSADCSDAMSTKQRSVTTPTEMPFCLLTVRFSENCFCGWFIPLEPTSVRWSVNDWFSQTFADHKESHIRFRGRSAFGVGPWYLNIEWLA